VERYVMATNLALDDALIEAAVRAGKHPSERAAVTEGKDSKDPAPTS
jgi:Arc/MetJ family transcription regulator